MDKRIEKVREDIRRAEARKREAEEYLKTLKMRERQLCDEEILKTMRALAGKGDVLETLQELTKKNNEKSYDKAVDSDEKKESAAFFDGKESEKES